MERSSFSVAWAAALALSAATAAAQTPERRVAVLEEASCALDAAGAVRCWGDARRGATGLGEGERFQPPTVVPSLPAAAAIAAGEDGACALSRDGEVHCWGRWVSEGGRFPVHRPFRVGAIDDAVEIVVGRGFACARRRTGAVDCWGRGREGTLGDGSSADRMAPGPVPGISDAVGLAASAGHACAVHADGRVSCWGNNHFGALGDGTLEERAGPVRVVGVADARAVAAGLRRTCAVRDGGRVSCWGTRAEVARRALRGARGRGPLALLGALLTPRFSRWDVGGLRDVERLVAGRYEMCAVVAGEVRCWIEPASRVPVAGLDDVRDLALGIEGHACAMDAAGDVRCWGNHRSGQLGADTATAVATRPERVPGLDDAVAVVSRRDESCALRRSGPPVCWSGGRHGDSRPRGAGPGPYALSEGVRVRWTEMTAGFRACGRDARGRVTCVPDRWGGAPGRRRPIAVAVSDAAQVLGLGGSRLLVRTRGGALRCVPEDGPPVPFDEAGVVDADAAAERACWVTAAGGIECARLREDRRDRCAHDREIVEGVADARRVFVGEGGACALRADARVSCWGAAFGPSRVDAPAGAESVAIGERHACARMSSGRVSCTGDNERGQRGTGDVQPPAARWSEVVGLEGVARVSAGGATTCTLHDDGTVSCWGGVNPAARTALGSVSTTPSRVELPP